MKETLDRVVIRFAGDSGDGMQLTGTQFTTTTALQGNDIASACSYENESDYCSREEVLGVDWRFHPGIIVNIPANVDQQS